MDANTSTSDIVQEGFPFSSPSNGEGPKLGDIFGNSLQNFSNTLQEKFPELDIDIPGLNCREESGPDCHQTRHGSFAIFMCSLIFSIFWITYITFLNARVVGSIVTKLANSKIAKKLIGDQGGYIEVRPV